MSTAGRLQDALHDTLSGYDLGDGTQVPGILADLDNETIWRVINAVVEGCFSVFAGRPIPSEMGQVFCMEKSKEGRSCSLPKDHPGGFHYGGSPLLKNVEWKWWGEVARHEIER